VSPETGGSVLRDERGCLTSRGFAVLERAPPGGAPVELASHVASCERCQQRWLHTVSGGATAKRKTAAPSPWRTLLILVAALALLLMGLFVTIMRLR
jgi:hypothetical protein